MSANNVKTFALIEGGVVTNVILWDGDEGTWLAPEGTRVRELKPGSFAGIGFSYNEVSGTFAAPPAPPPVPMTAEQARNQSDALLAVAALRMSPLQDAADLGIATPAEETSLEAWKRYRVDLSRVDQQPGFPANILWPTPPASD